LISIAKEVIHLLREFEWLITILGFGITIWQLIKVQNVAQAARQAAQDAKIELQKNSVLIDIASCTQSIEELKTLFRSHRYEMALVRVTSLHVQINQLLNLHNSLKSGSPVKFQDALVQLAIIREKLEQQVHDPNTSVIDIVKTINVLSLISDHLNDRLAKVKFTLTERSSQ